VPEAGLLTTWLRSSTKSAFFRAGHYRRRLEREGFLGVAVLSYHGLLDFFGDTKQVSLPSLHLAAREFDAHCRFIRKACNPISFSEWRAAANGGPSLPPRPVLVTFDDGYRSVMTVAHGILSRYDIPALAFVTTDAVERNELLWFDAVYRAHGVETVEAMKLMPFDKWLSRARASATPADPADPNAPLSADQVRVLSDGGLVEIGAHTMSHPILTNADCAVQIAEIRGSKEKLESWTGKPVHAFAYPNGDFTRQTMKLVSEAGFACAFTMEEGFAPRNALSFATPRFLVLSSVGVAELAHRLAYSWPRTVA
jgi:peptidoglycan/xylan/chitin deacetylase (PgdA/CDA1 family)